MYNWDSYKERISISINHGKSISINISMGVYRSKGSKFKFQTKCYWFWSTKAKITWAKAKYIFIVNLYRIEEFLKSSKKVNKESLLEYECLKQNDLFPKIKRNTISRDILTVLVHNLRWLSKLIMLCYVMLGEFTLYLPNDCTTQLRSGHIALGCLGDWYVFKTVHHHLNQFWWPI